MSKIDTNWIARQIEDEVRRLIQQHMHRLSGMLEQAAFSTVNSEIQHMQRRIVDEVQTICRRAG